MFLWHFPWGRPHWVLPSTLLYGARTFLVRTFRTRPPGLLGRPSLRPLRQVCQHSVRPHDFFRGVIPARTEVAREHYDSGMHGIPAPDGSSQFPPFLAASLYPRILDTIEEQEFNVVTWWARLGPPRNG